MILLVTNGSVTAFLLEKYSENKAVILALMIANTSVSLSVLFTYPIQLFPTLELIGPKFNAWWWKVRHGGKRDEAGNVDNDMDLTGFDPLPTLPEHDVASLSSYNDESLYDNFEKVTTNIPIKSDGADRGNYEANGNDLLRTSMISNITDPGPVMSIPGDSTFLRVGLVIMTYMVAVVVPNVQVLISLAGALAGSSTALLIPPMLELALIDHLDSKSDNIIASPRILPPSQQKQSSSSFRRLYKFDLSGKFWKKKLKCFCLFWTGFVFMLIGAYASISDIISIWFSTEKKDPA